VITSERLLNRRPSSDAEPAVANSKEGKELVLIVVGSSKCGASQSRDLEAAVKKIRQGLRTQATDNHQRFVTMGLALDEDPEVGLEFLRKFGSFDEIMTGGGWTSTGSLAYIVRDLPGRRAVPQLVVLERDVAISKTGVAAVQSTLVGRKVGLDEIAAFAAGISVPLAMAR